VHRESRLRGEVGREGETRRGRSSTVGGQFGCDESVLFIPQRLRKALRAYRPLEKDFRTRWREKGREGSRRRSTAVFFPRPVERFCLLFGLQPLISRSICAQLRSLCSSFAEHVSVENGETERPDLSDGGKTRRTLIEVSMEDCREPSPFLHFQLRAADTADSSLSPFLSSLSQVSLRSCRT